MAETPQQLSLRPTLSTLLDAHRWGVLVSGVWNQVSPTTMKTFVGLGPMTFTIDNVGASIVDGTDDVLITNTTAAAIGVQQYSPAIRQLGSGWETDGSTSMTVAYRNYVKTVQGSAAPSGLWVLESSINGVAYVQHISIASNSVVAFAGDIGVTGDIAVSGTVDGINISADVPANTAKVTNANHTGHVTGSGALTIAAGVINIAMHSASGTPDGTTFYRGDNTWAVPGGSGDMVLASVQTVTAAKTFEDTTFLLRNVADTFNGSFVNTNTADRIYTLQDAAGILAFVTRSIVNITGTKAEFDTAVSDGDIMYIGDAPTTHTHLLTAGATDVTATFGELNLLDLAGLTVGYVLSADSATTASWKAQTGSTPTIITVADESADTTCFPAFFTAATGDLGPKTASGLTFNSSTDTLSATGLQVGANAVLHAASTVSILTTVGVLNSGSITSGFGTINIGSSDITAGALTLTDDGWAGDAVLNIRMDDAAGGIAGIIVGNDTYWSDTSGGLRLHVDSGGGGYINVKGNAEYTAIIFELDNDTVVITTMELRNFGVKIPGGLSLRIQDSGNTDYVNFSHDGTDFNIVGTTTADINITGITSLNLGGVAIPTISSTSTFTGKTIDADGTGNVITNIGSSEVKEELISGMTLVTAVGTDMLLLWDATDSTLKRADAADFIGGGVPTTITVADESADTTCFIAFFTAATGDLGPKTAAGLTFNSSTDTLSATGLQVGANAVLHAASTSAALATLSNLVTVGALTSGSLGVGFTDVPVAQGGTGASDAATALSNLGGIGAATTNTLTNKRLTRRTTSIASSGTPTPNIDNEDVFELTALVVTAAFGAIAGTPIVNDTLMVVIQATGAETLSWNSGTGGYRSTDIGTLPIVTTAGKLMRVLFIYHGADDKWGCSGVSIES